MIKGQVISGKFGEILVRQKSDQEIELGELLIAKNKAGKILLQVYDLEYGSQISPQNLELISGMKLEEDADMEFMDPHLRNYTLARLKNLILIKDKENKSKAISSKSLPAFFSELREVTADDLKFLGKPHNSISRGYLRSGTKKLDVPVHLDGLKVFSHHILISGTTGKGKSVLMSNLLWDSMDKEYCALLVLDPHDEYYGRNKIGLKDHPNAKLIYYTSKNAPTGQMTLKINIKNLRPDHFDFMNFSGPQGQLMYTYYKKFKKEITKKNTIYQWRRKYVRENKNGVCPTLTANMGTGGHNVPLVLNKKGIRKLTPRECANFQGFPKNFKLPNIADSALYKQFGNSVSVPIIERIAINIKKALTD